MDTEAQSGRETKLGKEEEAVQRALSITRDGFLGDVEAELGKTLEGGFPPPMQEASVLLEAARHLCIKGGGKRVRPRLVGMFGEALDAPQDALVDIAVSGELIHAASLLHDDVVDEGTMRRGLPTARTIWDNKVSVLSGDMVLSLAFLQLRRHPSKITQRAIELVASMSRAAMMEIVACGRPDMSVESWWGIALGKTGALFGWCGEAVALLQQEEEAVQRFQDCGKHLGVAFQMADDLKDLRGDDPKDRFADIRNRNPSFCLLTASERSSVFRQHLKEAWSQERLSEESIQYLGEEVLSLGIAEHTYQALCREVELAIEALGRYGERAGGRDIVTWGHLLCQGLKEYGH
ncbi:MAG: polyprenyl synthetase family protein [Myxococcales bacterium]|nr:polyprenyl synthetase family protein [Myxococcales bacterium]MCB9644909.1 polyprenyl synthetase family protein [Myxococcales bacterium]